MNGRTEGWMYRWMDGRTDGLTAKNNFESKNILQ